MKFKVLAGSHHQVTGHGRKKTYKKGDVVESDRQLDKIFKNKFKQLGVTVEDEEGFVRVPVGRTGLAIQKKGEGEYFVINTNTSMVLNDEPVSKKQAEEMSGIKYIEEDVDDVDASEDAKDTDDEKEEDGEEDSEEDDDVPSKNYVFKQKRGEYFAVVRKGKKAMNKEPLSKKDAEQLAGVKYDGSED